MVRVGVLSLQGAFREHLGILDSLGVSSRRVTRPEHLSDLADEFAATFIRAPQIIDLGPSVEVLGAHNEVPVLVRQGNVWGGSFHPELGADTRIHEEFLHSLGVAV